jgi:glutaredoxin
LTDPAAAQLKRRRERRAWLVLVILLLVVTGLTQGWGALQRAAVGERVAAAASAGDIQMISSTTCGVCTQARQWFAAHQVPVDECFIERNAACADRFRQLLAPGTPVIVVRGQAQLGFDPQRIAQRLESPRP